MADKVVPLIDWRAKEAPASFVQAYVNSAFPLREKAKAWVYAAPGGSSYVVVARSDGLDVCRFLVSEFGTLELPRVADFLLDALR